MLSSIPKKHTQKHEAVAVVHMVKWWMLFDCHIEQYNRSILRAGIAV